MKRMIEIIIGVLIFAGGFVSGYFLAPKEVNHITQIDNHYHIENRQQTETLVYSGQVQLLISGSNFITNINVNLKDITNVSIAFITQSNTLLAITNKK
ncbi:MAG: hypothetical protein HPY78_03415 [Brevinematales bacterium]|nr:hypothetical protein [Brevinematales bacterium]